LKKFGTYTDAETKRPLLLLDNRKVFTTDKTRVKAAANRNGVPMPSCSRAPETAPSGRIRRHIEDCAESDDDDIFQQPKNPPADSESEKEFVDYEPFVRQPSVINLSNLKSSGEALLRLYQTVQKHQVIRKSMLIFHRLLNIKRSRQKKKLHLLQLSPWSKMNLLRESLKKH